MNAATHSKLIVLCALAISIPGDAGRAAAWQRIDSVEGEVLERGPHHRVQEVIHRYASASGQEQLRTNSYVVLGTGLHHWEDGQWKVSRSEVEIFDGAAVARHGPIKVIFAANLNSAGAIDMVSPEGRRFRSHILGLAYTDAATGKSVLIAEVRDCLGGVLPPNEVVYQDAFEGDVIADVRYTYSPGGFEQDIVLLAAPPSPAEWGLNPESTRLEVWTEFLEAPEPNKNPTVLRQQANPIVRNQWFEPDLVDFQLDFGDVAIDRGYAFDLGNRDVFNQSVPTAKAWISGEGRRFLIEKVEYRDLLPHLQGLPQMAANRPRAQKDRNATLMARHFPQPPRGDPGKWRKDQWARLQQDQKGLVMDYTIILGSLTNYVFQGDTTYYVSNHVSLYGTTTFEGGTVLKYDGDYGGTGANLYLNGPVNCLTSAGNPAVFTAKDDDSVGQAIAGSTGSPSGTYGFYTLGCKDTSAAYDWHDVRVRHGYYGFAMFMNASLQLRHAQLSSCFRTLASYSVTNRFQNILIHDAEYGIWTGGSPNIFEHATFHRVKNFVFNTNATPPRLTNTLVIAVTNKIVYSGGSDVVVTNDDTGIFQTVASGSRYLASGSSYRNVGTTNIDAGLLADLRDLTTHPPEALTNSISIDTILSLQAPRDQDTPDLGYHYDPIDYVAQGVTVTNATLMTTNGCVVGIAHASINYGISLASGGSLVSQGLANRLNRFLMVHAVQEDSATYAEENAILKGPPSANAEATATFRFTELPLMANAVLLDEGTGAGNLDLLKFQDCILRNGTLTVGTGSSNALLTLTNNALDRLLLILGPTNNATIRVHNNLFKDGTTALLWLDADAHLYDNYFHNNPLLEYYVSTPSYDFNAVITNETYYFSVPGDHDVILTNKPTFLTGPLGSYYYPTNDGMLSTLLDVGSMNATNAGLYHFTVLTSQEKEAATQVDIGFHFVAVDGNGDPWDEDEDGMPDYLEDLNGNGSADAGETDWTQYDSASGLLLNPSLEVFIRFE